MFRDELAQCYIHFIFFKKAPVTQHYYFDVNNSNSNFENVHFAINIKDIINYNNELVHKMIELLKKLKAFQEK